MTNSENEDGSPNDGEPIADLSRPDVAIKYRTAGDIANLALQTVVAGCVDGADIHELCRMADTLIEDKVAGIHNKKVKGEVPKKGVAFPTCLSLNEICGHYQPLQAESTKLKQGDICKVDLGCHIDGFIAVAAHTLVVPDKDGKIVGEGDTGSTNITGRKADVMMAAWTALEAAVRLVKEGKTNREVTEVITLATEQFNCSPVRGVLSHQLKRHVIDGNQVIIGKETVEEKVDEFTFQANEVYAIDMIVSTGDGKTRESELRTTIYKRDLEQTYNLKTHLGRKFLHEVNSRFPTLPFTLCAFEEETPARVGVTQCMQHSLLIPYPVVTEKAGEFVAQFKCTVLLLPGGTKKITGLPFVQRPSLQSEHTVTDQTLLDLLATPIQSAKKKKSKPKQPKTDKTSEKAVDAGT